MKLTTKLLKEMIKKELKEIGYYMDTMNPPMDNLEGTMEPDEIEKYPNAARAMAAADGGIPMGVYHEVFFKRLESAIKSQPQGDLEEIYNSVYNEMDLGWGLKRESKKK